MRLFRKMFGITALCGAVLGAAGEELKSFTLDFESPAVPVELKNPDRWVIADGVISSPKVSSSLFFGDKDWQDYELTFKLRRTFVKQKDQHFGVRLHNGANQIMIYCRGDRLIYSIAGTKRHATLGMPFDKQVETGKNTEWLLFNINVAGNKIEVKLDGRVIGVIDDVPPGTGPIAIYNYGNEIDIDDLQVTCYKTGAPEPLEPKPAGSNIVLNSSFEECTNDELPDFWGVAHWGIQDPYWAARYDQWVKNFRSNATVAYHGKRSMRIENPVDGPASIGLILRSCNFGSKVGSPYKLSAYMKADQPGAKIKMHDKIVELTTDWQRYECDFRRPSPNLYQDMLNFAPLTRGVFYIDAVQLEEGGAVTPYALAASDRKLRTHEGNDKVIHDVPIHPTRRMDAKVTLDGKLDEELYRQIEPVNFVTTGNQKVKADTKAWFWYDSDGIRIGVDCDDPKADELACKVKNRDGFVWTDPSIEIFLDPKLSRGDYYHLVFNTDGVCYDAYCGDGNFNSSWQVATKLRPDNSGWTAEAFIPFGDLNIDRVNGDLWGFNLTRNNHRLNEPSLWAPTYGRFHTPTRFGQLKIANDVQKEYYISSDNISLKRSGNGDIIASGKIVNDTDRKVDLNVELTVSDIARKEKQNFTQKVTLNAHESKLLTFGKLTISPAARYRMELNIKTADGEMRHASNGFLDIADLLSARIQHDYYTGEKEMTIRGEADLTPEQIKQSQIAVTVSQNAKTVAARKENLTDGVFKQSIAIDQLPVGNYDVVVDLLDRDGKVMATKNLELIKLAPNPVEVKIDRFSRVLLVNGKPFFARGFFWEGGMTPELVEHLAKTGTNIIGLDINVFKDDGSQIPVLDAAYKNGVMVYLFIHARRGEDRVKKMIEMYKNHPAVIVWYAFDEVFTGPWGKDDPQKVFDMQKRLQSLDPYRPVIAAENRYGMSFLKEKNLGFPGQLVSMDYYSWPPDGNFAETGVHCRTLYELGRDGGKPAWAYLLGAGYAFHASRDYTAMEHEYSAYSALINGMTGIVYFASHPKSPSGFAKIQKNFREIEELTPILLSLDKAPEIGGGAPSIEFLVKQYRGDTYLIAVNNVNRAVDVKFDLSKLPGAENIEVLFENRRLKPVNKVFGDRFDGYQRHVYKITQ